MAPAQSPAPVGTTFVLGGFGRSAAMLYQCVGSADSGNWNFVRSTITILPFPRLSRCFAHKQNSPHPVEGRELISRYHPALIRPGANHLSQHGSSRKTSDAAGLVTAPNPSGTTSACAEFGPRLPGPFPSLRCRRFAPDPALCRLASRRYSPRSQPIAMTCSPHVPRWYRPRDQTVNPAPASPASRRHRPRATSVPQSPSGSDPGRRS